MIGKHSSPDCIWPDLIQEHSNSLVDLINQTLIEHSYPIADVLLDLDEECQLEQTIEGILDWACAQSIRVRVCELCVVMI